QKFSTHINGYGGIGFLHSGTNSGGQVSSDDSLLTGFGFAADGFLYHPLLATYALDVDYDRTNDTVDQGDVTSRALTLHSGLSLLPESSHPAYVYFTRQNSNLDGSLVSPFSVLNTNYGVRGFLNGTPAGEIGYHFGSSVSDNRTSFDN